MRELKPLSMHDQIARAVAKPGQRIVKGVLPEFRNLGNKAKPQSERGTCERCGQKPDSRGIKAQTINGVTIKVCDSCSSKRSDRVSTVDSKLVRIQEKAMEEFRKRKGDSSMVSIKPRRNRSGRK